MTQRWKRFLLTALRWAAMMTALAAAALYLLASWQPASYHPPQLTQSQREGWAKHFVRASQEFSNAGQWTEPYTWILREEDLNYYLASIDEIVFLQAGRKRGEVDKVLDTAGLTGPVINLWDNGLTVMLKSNEYGKVLSADLELRMIDDGHLRVLLTDTRIGLLPVPRFAVRSRLRQFKAALKERLDRLARAPKPELRGSRRGIAILKLIKVEELMASLILAIDEEPLPVHYIRIFGDRRVRLRDIIVEPDQLTLDLVPVLRGKDEDEEKDDD